MSLGGLKQHSSQGCLSLPQHCRGSFMGFGFCGDVVCAVIFGEWASGIAHIRFTSSHFSAVKDEILRRKKYVALVSISSLAIRQAIKQS